MREAITDAQWAAGRALAEGEPQTHARIAANMGVHTTTVSHRASEECWKSLDFRHERIRVAQRGVQALAAAIRAGQELDPAEGELDGATRDALAQAGLLAPAAAAEMDEVEPLSDLSPGERIARIGAILNRRTEAILQRVEAGQPVESRQVAALSSLVQLSERIAVMAQQEVAEEARKSDDELAAILQKVNDRIIYLAVNLAKRILLEHGMTEAAAHLALTQRRTRRKAKPAA